MQKALLLAGIALAASTSLNAHSLPDPEQVEDYDTCVLEFLSESQDPSATDAIKSACASLYESDRLIPDEKQDQYDRCVLRYLPRSEDPMKTRELQNRCRSKVYN